MLTAGYLINRTLSVVLNGKTPYEMLHGQSPPLKHLRNFGCLCYAHNQGRKGDKFASKSRKCIFVGYPYGKKGWKLFDLDKNEYFVSRDVVLVENEYPFNQLSDCLHEKLPLNSHVKEVNVPDCVDDDVFIERNVSTTNDRGGTYVEIEAHEGSTPLTESLTSDTQEEPHVEQEKEQMGRGYRTKLPSSRLKDFVTNTIRTMSPSNRSLSSLPSSGSPYPIAHYVNCNNFSLAHRVFLAAIEQEKEPMTYNEGVKDHRWRKAMQSEVDALENNQTWTITSLPAGKKALGCKWVYKIKRKSDGTVERFKARLVILRNYQVEGIDYTETFAPVAKMVTVQAVLAVATARDWELHHMDVHNAFLHGDLQEEVFMKLPAGFNVS